MSLPSLLIEAYVGPGAGFALLSSFFVLFTTVVIVVFSLLIWPVRRLWRLFTRPPLPPAKIRRLIVVGFDGQDPKLTEQYMKEGLLPNFSKLAEQGAYRHLRTTFPSVSPVAWSSFSTGCEPSRHNIFDFIEPDRRTYLPLLSSTRIGHVTRFWKLGRYRIPREKPELRLLRKSRPFWSILGDHHIWSTILRVPITFPPDRFYGAQLSAMCVPDLLGTQGTFLLFTTREAAEGFEEGGARVLLPAGQDVITTSVEGPENILRAGAPPMKVPLRIAIDRAHRRVHVSLADTSLDLVPGELSDWVKVRFPAVPGVGAHGLTRLLVTEMDDHFSLYMSPINLDPERPAMPISASLVLCHVPREAHRALCDTWARRGHVGPQRGRHRRCDVPAADVRHRRRTGADVLCRPGPPSSRQPRLRLRCHRPHPAHVLAAPGTRASRHARRGASCRHQRDP